MARPQPPIVGFGQWLRRVFGIGRVRHEGRVSGLERFVFTRQPGNVIHVVDGSIGATPNCVWIFLDGAEDPVGWAHSSVLMHKAKKGERVEAHVHPEDGYIGRIRPLDRRMRWWQF